VLLRGGLMIIFQWNDVLINWNGPCIIEFAFIRLTIYNFMGPTTSILSVVDKIFGEYYGKYHI
jgi:hypothetical protein